LNIKSVNEPGTSREMMLTPASVNEPPVLPEWASEAPVVESITPTETTIGDPSFDVVLSGSGFYEQSVIVFASHDEPTTLTDGKLSTGVNMDVWQGADTVKVSVRNGPIASNEVDFTFKAATEARADDIPVNDGASGLVDNSGDYMDPDDLEEEIEEAGDEGDFKPVHRGKPSRSLPKNRK
jgi:hypothetical protein